MRDCMCSPMQSRNRIDYSNMWELHLFSHATICVWLSHKQDPIRIAQNFGAKILKFNPRLYTKILQWYQSLWFCFCDNLDYLIRTNGWYRVLVIHLLSFSFRKLLFWCNFSIKYLRWIFDENFLLRKISTLVWDVWRSFIK